VPALPDHHEPWKLDQPVGWVFGTVGAFPFRNQPAPTVVYVVYLTIFVSVLVVALRVARGRRRRVLAVTTLGVLVMPFVLTAATYSGRGVIWQGRYGLPLAVGVPLLAAVALERYGPRDRFVVGAMRASAVALPLLAAPCLLHVRAMEVHRAASLTDPAWHVPAPPVVVLLVVLSSVAVGGAMRRSSPVGDESGVPGGAGRHRLVVPLEREPSRA
jgi:multisubunit Na+/H+ antiporter MnhF subunit